MFDEKNNDRNDALGRCIRDIADVMLPPAALEEAVKAGVPYRKHNEMRAGVHVRRFSKAVLAYAACVVVLLGTVFILPRLFESDTPAKSDPVTTPNQSRPLPPDVTDEPTPEALYNELLTADDVVVTVTNILKETECVATYTISGPLGKFENTSTEALIEPAYFDFENGKHYFKMIADDDWTVADSNCADRTEFVQENILLGMPWFFENDDYEIKDGKYVFTKKAINAMINEFKSTGYVDTITLMVGEPFEIEVTYEATDEGGIVSYVIAGDAGSMVTNINIQFVETEVILPEVTE